eukprot:TRINITY_DN50636_c0_g1_i1.p1 TRINITY_DN50636_c0_g1~~TRINITY_DN50636_c0_g1_i1.p1  ORF type:complete len:646 (-),score=121.60 TRINITY_DN50636_c0_g1_i1:103-2040(-)
MAAAPATSRQSAEAILGDIAVLEAALREAAADRRGISSPAGPVRTAELPMGLSNADLRVGLVSDSLDSAVTDYGIRLRFWVDQQVDARINQVMVGMFDQELHASRQESAVAFAKVERLERELCAAADAQTKLLSVVEAMSEEMTRLKAAVTARQLGTQASFEKHEAELDDLRRNHGHHERSLAELHSREISDETNRAWRIRGLDENQEEEQAKQRDRLSRQLEENFAACRAELHAEITAEFRSSNLSQNAEERLEMILDSLRSEVAVAASLRADIEKRFEMSKEDLKERILQELRSHVDGIVIEELKNHVDVSQARLNEDIAACQQRLFSELRAETTAAFRNEAAAVAALDEQLWLTDQRLGQRIDEISHLHLRDRVATAERRTRDVNSVPTNGLTATSSHVKTIEERMLSIANPSLDDRSSTASPRGGNTTITVHATTGVSSGGVAIGPVVSNEVGEGIANWWQRSSNDVATSAKTMAISEAAAERARLAASAVSSAGSRCGSHRSQNDSTPNYTNASVMGQTSICEPVAVTVESAPAAGTSPAVTTKGMHQTTRSNNVNTNIGHGYSLGGNGNVGAISAQVGSETVALKEALGWQRSDAGGGVVSPSFGAGAARGGTQTTGALASWLMTGSTAVAASSPSTSL